MGWMEDLFGGDPEVRRGSTLSGNQKAIDQRFAEYLYPRIAGANSYRGRQIAPMSALQQQGYGMAQQYVSNPGAYMNARQNAYGNAVAGRMIPQANMDAQRKAYADLWGKYAGQATENARGMGALTSSSAMARANSGAAKDYALEQAKSESDIMQRNAELNAMYQQAAMNSQDPYQQQQAMGMQAAYQYGDLPRQIQQLQLDAQDEYTRNLLNQAMAYLGMQQVSSYSYTDPGFLGRIAAPVGIGVGAAMGTRGMGGTSGGGGGGGGATNTKGPSFGY